MIVSPKGAPNLCGIQSELQGPQKGTRINSPRYCRSFDHQHLLVPSSQYEYISYTSNISRTDMGNCSGLYLLSLYEHIYIDTYTYTYMCVSIYVHIIISLNMICLYLDLYTEQRWQPSGGLPARRSRKPCRRMWRPREPGQGPCLRQSRASLLRSSVCLIWDFWRSSCL